MGVNDIQCTSSHSTFGRCCSMSAARELRFPGLITLRRTAGHLGAFDSFSGAFIGAVVRLAIDNSRNFPVLATDPGAFTLDRTGNPSNYLAVIAFTNSTSEGDAALLQILNPGDPNVSFISLVVGVPNCNTAAFSGIANPSASLLDFDSCFQFRVF
ncbi:hypothetical protein DFH09DRAFT_1471839 [Mycena vulgaris]|nr:hypothetical protein DFH09DRAFT_1471839 [Mycena vulgaris]